MKRFVGGILLAALTPLALADALETVPVAREAVPQRHVFSGRVEAVRQSTVSAQTSGRVAAVYADLGDHLPAGARILSLMGVEQRQALEAAEAALAEAQAQARVTSQEYQRISELAARNLAARAELDRVTAAQRAAQARVASARAGVERMREQLGYTDVLAPYGGVVSARHVELGELVQPGTPLMSGFDPEALRVRVDLPQGIARQVTEVAQIQVQTEGAPVVPVRWVRSPVADPLSSTVQVRLDLPEGMAGLMPGQYVATTVALPARPRLLVPVACVVRRAEVTAVYVVREGRPVLRHVRLGEVFGERVEVLAGVEDTDLIARDPTAAGIALHQEMAHEP